MPNSRVETENNVKTLSEMIWQLLQVAESGRWDDLVAIAAEAQDIFQKILTSNTSLKGMVSREELSALQKACEHLKLLCQERREQIAPLIEKLERITPQSG